MLVWQFRRFNDFFTCTIHENILFWNRLSSLFISYAEQLRRRRTQRASLLDLMRETMLRIRPCPSLLLPVFYLYLDNRSAKHFKTTPMVHDMRMGSPKIVPRKLRIWVWPPFLSFIVTITASFDACGAPNQFILSQCWFDRWCYSLLRFFIFAKSFYQQNLRLEYHWSTNQINSSSHSTSQVSR